MGDYFSRAISVATQQNMRTLRTHDTGRMLPVITHEGIYDGFVDKWSVAWYWNGTRWLRVEASD